MAASTTRGELLKCIECKRSRGGGEADNVHHDVMIAHVTLITWPVYQNGSYALSVVVFDDCLMLTEAMPFAKQLKYGRIMLQASHYGVGGW
jgi:hypothetical protein